MLDLLLTILACTFSLEIVIHLSIREIVKAIRDNRNEQL